MSMITEQVKRLRSEAAGMILQNGTTARLLREAASTIERLAAKVRVENNVSQPCEDAIPIPDNATNGDMIKALFPDEEFTVKDYYQAERSIVVICNKDNSMEFDPIWWNSPYKRGDTE